MCEGECECGVAVVVWCGVEPDEYVVWCGSVHVCGECGGRVNVVVSVVEG